MPELESQAIAPEPRQLVLAIGKELVAQVEPEELAIYDEVAEEYLANPIKVLAARKKDEAVGFGLDLLVCTPAVLDCLIGAATWLGLEVLSAGVAQAVDAGLKYVENPKELPPLTPEQETVLRQSTEERGRTLGLSADKATRLADELVERLVPDR